MIIIIIITIKVPDYTKQSIVRLERIGSTLFKTVGPYIKLEEA